MAITELPDFDSMSEFGAYNGDCWFAVALAFLHSIDPKRWPLNFATLDALVRAAHAAGYCEANGAINVPHLSAWLSWLKWVDSAGRQHVGVAHETYCSYGGALPGDHAPWHPFVLEAFEADGKTLVPGCLHHEMKTRSGRQGIGIERGPGAPLPGDEPHVEYHYIGDGGIDTGPLGDGVGGAYLFADGDNSADHRDGSATSPIRYRWQMVRDAGPVGFVVITEPRVVIVPPAPKPVVITLTAQQVAAVKAA